MGYIYILFFFVSSLLNYQVAVKPARQPKLWWAKRQWLSGVEKCATPPNASLMTNEQNVQRKKLLVKHIFFYQNISNQDKNKTWGKDENG